MMTILPVTAVPLDLKPATSLDWYVRHEFRDPDSAWVLAQARAAKKARRPYRRPNGDRLIRRAARAIVTFLF
jgi:hypothetical protein